MRFGILSCDYEGTLAHHGILKQSTAAALDRFGSAGGRLLLVTGRELPELQSICKRSINSKESWQRTVRWFIGPGMAVTQGARGD